MELPLVTDGGGLSVVTNDLGFEIEVSEARLVVEDFEFTVAGEAHTSLLRRLSDAVVPVAHAHPGHFQAGDVTGELRGHFVLRFAPGETREVGTATLLVGTYQSANVTLGHASSGDVAEDDPLLGHTAILSGSASKEDAVVDFEIGIDSPAGRQLVGIPFEAEITEAGQEALHLRLLPLDPLEMDTLFDGLDFAALDADADGQVRIAPGATDTALVGAYNTLRRALQTHDHFQIQSLAPTRR